MLMWQQKLNLCNIRPSYLKQHNIFLVAQLNMAQTYVRLSCRLVQFWAVCGKSSSNFQQAECRPGYERPSQGHERYSLEAQAYIQQIPKAMVPLLGMEVFKEKDYYLLRVSELSCFVHALRSLVAWWLKLMVQIRCAQCRLFFVFCFGFAAVVFLALWKRATTICF